MVSNIDRDEFRWQKQRFMIQMGVIVFFGLLTFLSVFYMKGENTYRMDKELSYFISKTKQIQYDSEKSISDINDKINKLEVNIRNNEEVIQSLKSDIASIKELINALSMQLKAEKDKNNDSMGKE